MKFWVISLLILLGATTAGPASTSAPATTQTIEALIIKVEARQWAWRFTYPNGKVSEELHLPDKGEVDFETTSRDVIHAGVFLPHLDQNISLNAAKGKVDKAALKVDRKPGQYRLICVQYCGAHHSQCGAKVIIQSEPDFQKWLTTKPTTAQ